MPVDPGTQYLIQVVSKLAVNITLGIIQQVNKDNKPMSKDELDQAVDKEVAAQVAQLDSIQKNELAKFAKKLQANKEAKKEFEKMIREATKPGSSFEKEEDHEDTKPE